MTRYAIVAVGEKMEPEPQRGTAASVTLAQIVYFTV
jgi:hypothetical protein